jgi:hypothetical protein
MITITPLSDKFILACNEDERATIDKLLSKQNRKLERHIEEYLASRKLNIREQENMLIMTHMSEEERLKRLKEIEEKPVIE